MNNSKVKLLVLTSLLAGLGAVIAAFAAGSHLQISFTDGAFSFDFKVATGHSGAATVLGLIALAAGLIGVGLHGSRGPRGGGEAPASAAAASEPEFPEFPGALRRLTKSKTDVWLGGVCGGLGEHTALPSWVWRLLFLLLLCWYGLGALLYVFLWICLPEPLREASKSDTPPGRAALAAE